MNRQTPQPDSVNTLAKNSPSNTTQCVLVSYSQKGDATGLARRNRVHVTHLFVKSASLQRENHQEKPGVKANESEASERVLNRVHKAQTHSKLAASCGKSSSLNALDGIASKQATGSDKGSKSSREFTKGDKKSALPPIATRKTSDFQVGKVKDTNSYDFR